MRFVRVITAWQLSDEVLDLQELEVDHAAPRQLGR